MKTYAYARVSANDQNLHRQIDSFRSFGIEANKIYCDKKSGKNFDRQNYQRLIRKLTRGDLVVIKSIDRLGRNYTNIIEEWQRITDKIGANILVLDMPLLDTREKDGSLTSRLISDLVLQILSFVAENERVNIRVRQQEGIIAAKSRGVVFGRPQLTFTEHCVSTIKRFKAEKITTKEACKILSVKRSTLYYYTKKITEQIEYEE